MLRKRVAAKPIFTNKEDGNFREALLLYELKQYKKLLKLVEQILKKNLGHAELFALKGLILHHQGDKEDAAAYIAKGIAKGPDNPIVCHMTAIYKRAVEDFAGSALYYKRALDNGATNNTIFRDLLIMELQVRDYKGLAVSRQAYLEDQPGYRANWTGAAVAYHLGRNYLQAELTLLRFEELVEGKLNNGDMFEHSECLLYKNVIISDSGDTARALSHLEQIEPHVFDKTALLELRAKYLLQLERSAEALVVCRRLLARNPDNIDYYRLLEESLGTATAAPEVRLRLYARLARFYPRLDPPVFVPLTFLDGSSAEFAARAKAYLVGQLARGVPSAFVNVKPLLRDASKRQVVEAIAAEYHAQVDASEHPLRWVWSTHFLLCLLLRAGEYARALELVDAAIAHTPTLVELHMLRARVLKHSGDRAAAAEGMDKGRLLDLQDRFINSKTAKYYLRSNNILRALEVALLFTKNDKAPHGLRDLHMMQVTWFVTELGAAYQRMAAAGGADDANHQNTNLALAAKRFQAVVNTYHEFLTDQVDFHSYCMRRGTPRAYLDMIQWADRLYTTPVFLRVVRGLGAVCLAVADRPAASGDSAKPKRGKKPKANGKKHQEELAEYGTLATDADPMGSEAFGALVALPLDVLAQVWKPCVDEYGLLALPCPRLCVVHRVGYEMHLRERKYLLALQELAAVKVHSGGEYPGLALMVGALKQQVADDTTVPLAIGLVMEKSVEKHFPGLQAQPLEADWLAEEMAALAV